DGVPRGPPPGARVGGPAPALAGVAGVRRADAGADEGDHRAVPAAALGAAAAAAPGAVGGGVRQPGRHPLLRRGAGADHRRGVGGRDVLHDVQAHPVRRAPRQRLHQHPVRGAGRRRHLRAAEDQAGCRPRGDRGRARVPGVDHAGARRVPRGLRPRAGAAGQLRVLRQPNRAERRGPGGRAAAQREAAPDPRRRAHRPAHRLARAGRDLPRPGALRRGPVHGARDAARRRDRRRARLDRPRDARHPARLPGAGGEEV
ncbi:MAG: NADH-ubiquinone oxidoreductase chain E, partial [uncultured Pseudonocardia sp.]